MQDTNFSSKEFVQKLKDGDRQALEHVVRHYTEHLIRAAYGLGFESGQAEELVQKVWTTFFDVIRRFEGRSHVRTFIFGILYNKANEERRQFAKDRKQDNIEEVMEERFDQTGHWAPAPIDPESFALAAENIGHVEKCLEELSLDQKMAFCLREIDGESTENICNILEVTSTNLGVLMYRAKNKLRNCIERVS